MKRLILFLAVVLLWTGLAAALQVEAGSTSTTIQFVMRDSAGDPVTGLAGTDFTVYYSEFRGAEETLVCTALTAITDAYTSGGAYEIGHGQYRLDVPVDVLDGVNDDDDCIGDKVGLTITDETAAADNTYVILEISVPVNVVSVSGETPDTGSDIADDVWDEATADHTDDGTFGGDAYDADTAPDAIADGLLDELVTDHDDTAYSLGWAIMRLLRIVSLIR